MIDRSRIRHLHGDQGASIRGIARTEGVSRNAVRRAVRPGSRDRYTRASALADAEPAVRDVLADYPHISVADLATIIDWRRSRRHLQDLVQRIRPDYLGQPEVAAPSIYSLRTGTIRNVRALDARRLDL